MASVTLAFVTVCSLIIPEIIATSADNLQNLLLNGNYELIDLTHPFNNFTASYPGIRRFQFTKKFANRGSNASYINSSSWYAENDFETAEHAGTHIDAPYHFYEQGVYVGDIPLEKLILPLIVVDVSSKVSGNADFVLHQKDLDDSLNDKFGKPSLLLFRFGWSQYFNDTQKYFGLNGTQMRFPGLSTEVADWITSHKHILGVGVDGPSVDPGSGDLSVHRILSRAGLYNLENVNVHRPINEFNCTALVLPMKIEEGTGAPTRIVAVCPKETV